MLLNKVSYVKRVEGRCRLPLSDQIQLSILPKLQVSISICSQNIIDHLIRILNVFSLLEIQEYLLYIETSASSNFYIVRNIVMHSIDIIISVVLSLYSCLVALVRYCDV
jgi:hypothetical protein